MEIEGVSNSAFRQLMEFTYTATLAISSEEEASDVWKAAEYLQMQEALKALNNRSVLPLAAGGRESLARCRREDGCQGET